MRTQVLKRSHRKSSASFGGPNAPPSAKRRKFANEYLTTPESVSTLTPPVHEDNDFDLPQLDELVLDIDPDQHFEFQEFAGSTLDNHGQATSTATSSSSASQHGQGAIAAQESIAEHVHLSTQQALSQPEPCSAQLKHLKVPRNMLHPSFMLSSQSNRAELPELPMQQMHSHAATDESLSPSTYSPPLDFPELLLHDSPTHQSHTQSGHAECAQPQQQQQQQQQVTVQWYTADADVHKQQASAGSYVVIGAGGIQRQAHTASSLGLWEGHMQPEENALPNVIRKISNETATDPNTGRPLVYGRAMAHRSTEIELPSISALFNDISSGASQKSWEANNALPRANTQAARALARQRSTGMLGFFAAVPGKITAQDSPSGHMQPMSTACADTFTSLLNSPLLPADAAAPAGYVHAQAWQTESAHNSAAASVGQIVQHQWQGYTHGSGSAVTDNALAAVSNAQESDQQQLQQQQLWTHVQPNMPGMPAQQEPMQLGHSSNAGPESAAQRPQRSHSKPCTESPVSSKESFPAAKAGRKKFGGILSSVVKEAAETATKRPPVFHYEDFKTKQDGQTYQGVSRDRWCVEWNANVAKSDTQSMQAEQHDLGRFNQETMAARAVDVANLRINGLSAATNFPLSEYEEDMKELQDTSILDIVLALQRQGALGNFKNSRYEGVWQLDKSCWEARIEESLPIRDKDFWKPDQTSTGSACS